MTTFTYDAPKLTDPVIGDVSTPSWVNMTYDPSPETLAKYPPRSAGAEVDEPVIVTRPGPSDPTR